MRLGITLHPEHDTLTLPLQYNHIVQGFIYHQIEATLANWLHEEGYRTGERQFKLFTFSRIIPTGQTRYKIHNSDISFDGPVSFVLAAVNSKMLSSLAEHLLKASSVCLGRNKATVRGVEVLRGPDFTHKSNLRVKTLSPITTYSTLLHPSGGKKTYYYSPFEKDWHEQLRDNLVRKATALGWEADAAQALENASFKPLRVTQKDQKIITYKDTVIKGWMGVYELSGLPKAYLELLYDAGLGAKNSQGFGMVEVVR